MTISSTAISSLNAPQEKLWSEEFFSSQRWAYLVPTITAVALGILCISHFGLGLIAGVGMIVSSLILAFVIDLCKREEPKTKGVRSNYEKELTSSLDSASLVAPLTEEAIFRGGIQPILAQIFEALIPAASATFLGTGLSGATVVAILATSLFFGVLHASNDHAHSHLQAFHATISGLILGCLAAKFGIGAAFAAHLTNNTLATIPLAMLSKIKLPIIDLNP